MKRLVAVSIGVIALCGTLCVPALAQVADAPTNSTAVQDLSGIPEFFVSLATKYPWIATVLLIIGGLRVVFKPIMGLIDNYVKANCSPEEYAKLQSFESSRIYKWLSFGLDFVGSVKLRIVGVKPPQK